MIKAAVELGPLEPTAMVHGDLHLRHLLVGRDGRAAAGIDWIDLVAEANRDARAFYARHGLVTERRVNGSEHYGKAMSLELDQAPPEASGLLLRFTKQR